MSLTNLTTPEIQVVRPGQSPEHKILRHMRSAADLTMRKAATLVGISHAAISQFENGHMALPRHRIEQMVKAYGYTMEEYLKLLGSKEVAVNFKDECMDLIRKMDAEKVKAVHRLLMYMV